MINQEMPGHTSPIGAPVNWNPERDGPCGVLHVHRKVDEVGHYMMSIWKFSKEERQFIANGGDFVLVVRGQTHPVISVGVINEQAEYASAE